MTGQHETHSGLGDPIPRPFTNRAMHLLCRSEHFAVCSEYEYVWVEGKAWRNRWESRVSMALRLEPPSARTNNGA